MPNSVSASVRSTPKKRAVMFPTGSNSNIHDWNSKNVQRGNHCQSNTSKSNRKFLTNNQLILFQELRLYLWLWFHNPLLISVYHDYNYCVTPRQKSKAFGQPHKKPNSPSLRSRLITQNHTIGSTFPAKFPAATQSSKTEKKKNKACIASIQRVFPERRASLVLVYSSVSLAFINPGYLRRGARWSEPGI